MKIYDMQSGSWKPREPGRRVEAETGREPGHAEPELATVRAAETRPKPEPVHPLLRARLLRTLKD